MSNRLSQEPLENAERNPVAHHVPLRVVVVYEDAAARERIEDVYAHLVGKLSGDFRFGCTWCEFEELKDLRLANQATAAARVADLILFSADAAAEPPFAFLAWVESWAGSKAPRDTVLALLLHQHGPDSENGMAIKDYLHDVARRRDMDFLSQVIITPPDGSADTPMDYSDAPEVHETSPVAQW